MARGSTMREDTTEDTMAVAAVVVSLMDVAEKLGLEAGVAAMAMAALVMMLTVADMPVASWGTGVCAGPTGYLGEGDCRETSGCSGGSCAEERKEVL